MQLGLKCLASTVKILRSNSNSIYFNLAIEYYLFYCARLTQPTLFLWRNDKTIVIGRHQNPWKYCRNYYMKLHGVCLSRRKSGGGAVYQDLGNTCFSFLTPFYNYQRIEYKEVNNQIMMNTFAQLGVPVYVSGRNDLTLYGKKISGAAYRVSLGRSAYIGKRSLHHGTVLFSVDLQALERYLNPNKKKLYSKGINSIISRVMNLKERYPYINHDIFCYQIEKYFSKHYNLPIEHEMLDLKTISYEHQEINANYYRLKSWNWLYGECPEFKYTIENRFDWGLITVTFNVEDGFISSAKIYSDCLYPDFISAANAALLEKVCYGRYGFYKLQANLLQSQYPITHQMVIDLCQWMIKYL